MKHVTQEYSEIQENSLNMKMKKIWYIHKIFISRRTKGNNLVGHLRVEKINLQKIIQKVITSNWCRIVKKKNKTRRNKI